MGQRNFMRNSLGLVALSQCKWTPWRRAVLEKLTIALLIEKFPHFSKPNFYYRFYVQLATIPWARLICPNFHRPIYFLLLSTIFPYASFSQLDFSFQIFPFKICVYFLHIQCLLHAFQSRHSRFEHAKETYWKWSIYYVLRRELIESMLLSLIKSLVCVTILISV
jgi:hypothetical protein